MGVGSSARPWRQLSAEEVADVVGGFGAAYAPYAEFIRRNGVDGAMVVGCGGLEATLDMCEPPPTALHRQKFIIAAELNQQAVARAMVGADTGTATDIRSVAEGGDSVSAGLRNDASAETSVRGRSTSGSRDVPPGVNQAMSVGTELGSSSARGGRTGSTSHVDTLLLAGATYDEGPVVKDEDMPASLREFTPLSDIPWIRSLASAPALVEAERLLQDCAAAVACTTSPSTGALEEATAAALAAKTRDASAVLHEKLARLAGAVRDAAIARCNEKNIARKLRTVIADGNRDFLGVYGSVWSMIRNNDTKGTSAYREVVQRVEVATQSPLQKATNFVQLLTHAAIAKPQFDELVRSAAEKLPDADVSIPPRLKRAGRIVEKVELHATDPGNVRRIFDVVRGMVICASMTAVADAIRAFVEHPRVAIVRSKERFLQQPSEGGWRDFLLCFYIVGDVNKHICEVQIVHRNLLLARKHLPGHVVYNITRNASEIRGMLFASKLRLGWERTDAQRAGFNDSELARAGFAPTKPEASRDAALQLNHASRSVVVASSSSEHDKISCICDLARNMRAGRPRVVIECASSATCDRIVLALQAAGFESHAIHDGKAIGLMKKAVDKLLQGDAALRLLVGVGATLRRLKADVSASKWVYYDAPATEQSMIKCASACAQSHDTLVIVSVDSPVQHLREVVSWLREVGASVPDMLQKLVTDNSEAQTAKLEPPSDLQFEDLERWALVELHSATHGFEWHPRMNKFWRSKAEPVSQWSGVHTTVLHEQQRSTEAAMESHASVTTLHLGRAGLRGIIPQHVWQALPNLRYLSLFENAGLCGSIPTELGALTKLQWLDLSHTSIDGEIPTQVGQLSELTTLSLSHTRLTGQIPTELGNLTKLQNLYLQNTVGLRGPPDAPAGCHGKLWFWGVYSPKPFLKALRNHSC